VGGKHEVRPTSERLRRKGWARKDRVFGGKLENTVKKPSLAWTLKAKGFQRKNAHPSEGGKGKGFMLWGKGTNYIGKKNKKNWKATFPKCAWERATPGNRGGGGGKRLWQRTKGMKGILSNESSGGKNGFKSWGEQCGL